MNMFGQLKIQLQRIEIIATLQFAFYNIPYSCAENLAACYQQQFPDSSIAKNVSIVPTKMSCLVTSGLVQYFNQMTIRDVVQGHSYFTLHLDEIITTLVKKTNGFTCVLLVRGGQ